MQIHVSCRDKALPTRKVCRFLLRRRFWVVVPVFANAQVFHWFNKSAQDAIGNKFSLNKLTVYTDVAVASQAE